MQNQYFSHGSYSASLTGRVQQNNNKHSILNQTDVIFLIATYLHFFFFYLYHSRLKNLNRQECNASEESRQNTYSYPQNIPTPTLPNIIYRYYTTTIADVVVTIGTRRECSVYRLICNDYVELHLLPWKSHNNEKYPFCVASLIYFLYIN